MEFERHAVAPQRGFGLHAADDVIPVVLIEVLARFGDHFVQVQKFGSALGVTESSSLVDDRYRLVHGKWFCFVAIGDFGIEIAALGGSGPRGDYRVGYANSMRCAWPRPATAHHAACAAIAASIVTRRSKIRDATSATIGQWPLRNVIKRIWQFEGSFRVTAEIAELIADIGDDIITAALDLAALRRFEIGG